MKSTFYINNFNSYEPAQLIIEIGKLEVVFIILQNKTFTALAAYQLNDMVELTNLFATENLLQQTFTKVNVVYTNKQSALVPPVYFTTNSANSILELIYGNVLEGDVKNDFLYKHNIHCVYKIEAAIQNAVKAKFPFANISHQYSLLPDAAQLIGDKLFVVFYQNKFIVLCCIANQLQLIQQFEYSNAEDVAYYLLAIVQQHTMDVNALSVELSGMINENSNLYSELYKYFKNISFVALPSGFSYVTEIEALPTQYFAYLFSIAVCG